MKSRLLIRSLLCLLAYSAGAWAQSAPEPPPEAPPTIQVAQPQTPPAAAPPKIDLSTEPLDEPVQRTYHFHEGFYLRASVGFGYYYGSFSDGSQPHSAFNEHGGTMSLDLLLGGSPSPGLSIGAGLLVDPLFGAEYSRDGHSLGSHGGVSTLIGPFIDAFPEPTKGWHLGGLIGFAAQSFQNVNVTTEDGRERAVGIGGAAWFGYDFWVASEWAAGPQFRAMGARTSDTKSGRDVSAFASSFDLGISVVFN